MKLDFDIIIITSDEPYSKMWHTQLIYTEFLAKTNKVLYINPPKKWALKNIFGIGFKKNKVNENLTVIDYKNIFPASFKCFNKFNENSNERLISKYLKYYNSTNILVWHFDSYRNAFSNHFFDQSLAIKRIYHVIDPFYKNPIDRWLCKTANQIVITSLRNNCYYSDYSKKTINVPQCLDIELQKQLLKGHGYIEQKFSKNYFVLLGTISDDIDFDWLQDFLKNNEFKLVIIGKIISLTQTAKMEQVLKHPNVEYLGLLSPEEFYPVLKNAIAGLIIYNEERRAKVCSPLKTLNYIVANLPVISNIDCEIPELTGNTVYNATTIVSCYYLIELALNKNLKVNQGIIGDYLNKVSMSNAVDTITKNLSGN